MDNRVSDISFDNAFNRFLSADDSFSLFFMEVYSDKQEQ